MKPNIEALNANGRLRTVRCVHVTEKKQTGREVWYDASTACRIRALPFDVLMRDMRTLKLIEHISLDGVIQNSADDDDFPYSDWTAPYRTPAGRDAMLAAYGESFDLVLGRRTYDIWSDFWPKAPTSPMADGLNAAKKYVATHRPESLEWGPFEGLGPDIVGDMRRIKSQDGPDLILAGSSTLTSTLFEYGLADEVLLVVYPVLLGTGKRVFAEGSPARAFELVSTKAMPSGVIFSSYKVAGPLKAV